MSTPRTVDLPVKEVQKFAPNQPREPAGSPTGGQFASQGGGVSAKGLRGMLKDMHAHPDEHPNIIDLEVDGKKIFGGGKDLGIDREYMPQIPGKLRDEFLASLPVEPQSQEVDPGTLKPSQGQIDGYKTGRLYDAIKQGIGKVADKRILVTRDNFVLDGHHHWAAKIAYNLKHPGEKVKVTRVPMDFKQALQTALDFTKKHGIKGVPMHKAEGYGHVFQTSLTKH